MDEGLNYDRFDRETWPQLYAGTHTYHYLVNI